MSKNLKMERKESDSEEDGDSSNEDFDDPMNPDELKKEHQGYVIDGFVVDDHISSEDEFGPTEHRKLAPLVKEDDSDFEVPRKPKRLKRERDLISSPPHKIEAEFDFIERAEPRRVPLKTEVFDEEDYEEEDEEIEGEEDIEHRTRLVQMLNDMDIEGGDQLETQNIISTDWPERLQRRVIPPERKLPEVIITEALYIREKMKKYFDLSLSQDIILAKIKNCLLNLHDKGYDIMFQYFYCRQDLFPEIDLSHLWEIQRLDAQWSTIQDAQKAIEPSLQKIFNLMPVPESIFKLLITSSDKRTLDVVKEYCSYHFSKLNPGIDLAGISEFKTPKKSNVANEGLKVRLHEFAGMTGISPDALASNLSTNSKEAIIYPILHPISPEEAADSFVNPSHPLVANAESALRSLSKYMARELFSQPVIRMWLHEEYSRRVCISTVPTEKGRKELDATHPLYPAKRINKRKKNYLMEDEELWCMIKEAESSNLIKVKFVLPWDDDKRLDESRDEIFSILKKKYLSQISNEQDQFQNIAHEWNNLRIEVLQVLLKEFMYKWMEKVTREDIDERAERWLLSQCGESFKKLIFRRPFRKEILAENSYYEEDKGETKKSVTVRAMGLVYDPEKNITAVAAVEKNGEFLESMLSPGLVYKRENKYNENTSDPKALEDLKIMLEKYKPELLIVSANCLRAKDFVFFLRKNLEIGNLSYKVFVEYGECELPILQSKMPCKELNDLHPLVRQAICIARFKQDPLTTCLALWKNSYKDNPLLFLPLSPYQKHLQHNKLHDELERVAVECVNLVGVDINKVLLLEHHTNLLQFVSGLGPLKAKDLYAKLKSKLGLIVGRAELLNYCGQIILDNCIAFLRIKFDEEDNYLYNLRRNDRSINPLDGTRIHNMDYLKAEKIAREAMEMAEKGKALIAVIGQKKKLQELELRDYADRLATHKGQENQIHTLELIRSELDTPFLELRPEFKITDISLFYMLTRENPLYFRKGIYVTAKIHRVSEDKLLVTVEPSGIKGQIKLHHSGNYAESQIVRARLMKIGDNKGNFHDSETRGCQVFDDYNNELVLFSLEKDDLEFKRNRDLPLLFKNWDSWKSTFIVDPEEDFPSILPESTMKASPYTPRKINHPKFRNMSLNAALDYLSDKPDGEFVVRPSSKGEDSLNLTWKFFGNIVVHLNLREGPKLPFMSIAPKLYLNKDEFDSLDDIIHKYIIPCNQHMESLMRHKKFIRGEVDYIESCLVEDKKMNPLHIPYYYGCFENAPQFVVLVYMVKDERSNEKIIKEYIKIKPGGLFFHSTYFPSLNALTTWFKENFQSPEYQRYLRKVKPPVHEEPSKTQESLNAVKEERMKDEKNVKKERKRLSSVICNLCKRSGHVASECTSTQPYGHAAGHSGRDYSRRNRSRSRSRSRSNDRRRRHGGDKREYKDHRSSHRDRDNRENRDNRPRQPRSDPYIKREEFQAKNEPSWNNNQEGWNGIPNNQSENRPSNPEWEPRQPIIPKREENGWGNETMKEGWGDAN